MQPTLACLLVFCLGAPAAFAGEGAPEHPEPGMAQMFHGKLTELDRSARAFTIETPMGPERFTLIEGGTVLGAGEEVGLEALAVGQRLAVEAVQDETDVRQARSVQIVDPRELAGQLEDEPAVGVADTVTVVAVDAEAKRLNVQTVQGPRTYETSDATRIRRGRDEIPLEDLASGERVVVSGDEASPGRWVARSVTVVSGPAAPGRSPEER